LWLVAKAKGGKMIVHGDGRDREYDPSRAQVRRRRYWRGVFAEHLAALWLMLKGYRILARRWVSRHGEIDLVAVRGNCLVFVEVKQRESLEAAQASIGSRQRMRVHRAAENWMKKHQRFEGHELRFDLVFIVPGLWPHHIIGGL